MSKSIASYPEGQRRDIIARRLAQSERGAGYWAARAAADKLGIKVPAPKKFTAGKGPRKRRRDSEDQDQARRRGSGHKPFKQLLAR